MARILLIQTQQFPYAGLYYICGALKSAGHNYKVIASNNYNLIKDNIQEFKPIIIGLPCLTGLHKEVLKISADIKKYFPKIKILIGGIHPTLFPQIINDKNIDFICRGEGEQPVCELIEALDSGHTNFNIPNISWKKNGQAHHNEMRDLVSQLDSLPFPDYSIYSNSPVIANDTYPAVFMTRGCPFSCTYCHNSNQREIYKNKGQFVRSFSPDRVIKEIESAIKYYPKTRAVFLGADTIGHDVGWLEDLLTKYKKKFKIPYTCLIRPEFINEKLVELLKKTNCHMIAFGVESGSIRVRKELLNRYYTNEQIITAAKLLKKNDIKFRTYNIVGYPSETQEEMLETLKLNIKIKPAFPWCSIYTPYPETKLAEYSMNNGYLDKKFSYDDVPCSFFNDTILINVNRNYILNTHSFFQLTVLFPALFPIIKKLLNTKHNKLYKIIFKAMYSIICIKSERRSIISFARLSFVNRKLFK